MTRPTPCRRSPLKLETLESRELLAAGGPSAEAQYMLELINQARTNPADMANRVTSDVDPDVSATVNYYGVDLNAVRSQIASSASRPPVAWSDRLVSAAIEHSVDMANTGVQSHTGSDGSTLDQRLDRAGYGRRVVSAENAYAYANSVDHAMDAFLIDWGVSDHGHRKNILQPDARPDQYYREVGIGIIEGRRSNVGPRVITQNFGTRAGADPFIVGVAFSDSNRNRRYDLGEGQGNVEVTAVNVDTGEARSTSSWDAGGGYQIQVPSGTYDVTARVNGQVVRTQRVWVGDQNVKVDYNLNDAWQPPTPPAPTSFTFSNASNVAPANVAAQQLQAPTRAARGGWFASWAAWTARRVS